MFYAVSDGVIWNGDGRSTAEDVVKRYKAIFRKSTTIDDIEILSWPVHYCEVEYREGYVAFYGYSCGHYDIIIADHCPNCGGIVKEVNDTKNT